MRRRLPLLFLCLLLTSCLPFMRQTRQPIPTQTLAASDDAECSLILLPGFWDRPADFERHEFAAPLDDLSIRVIAVDAHVGYYRERSILQRLQEVVEPEAEAGRRIFLAGNSLGGVGGLIYARHRAGPLHGLVLLAPYLGEDELIREIEAAGGPLQWAPAGTEPSAEEPEGRGLDREEFPTETWRWLADWHRRGADDPPIWLGWGVDDDFAYPAGVAASLLPEGHALAVPGGHDWKAWTRAWREIVEAGAFDSCRVSPAPPASP